MTAKEIVVYFINTYHLQNINWPLQIKLAQQLQSKYKGQEIKYAINYYKDIGREMYSLGWLLYKDNMRIPLSLYHAEINMQKGEDSGERNWNRINQQNSKAKYRTEYPCNLFEESE